MTGLDRGMLAALAMTGAGGGNGTLFCQGITYPFRVSVISGIGASTLDAQGEVYKLANVAQFPGAYARGRYGYALGSTCGGDLRMQNE